MLAAEHLAVADQARMPCNVVNMPSMHLLEARLFVLLQGGSNRSPASLPAGVIAWFAYSHAHAQRVQQFILILV